VKNADFQQYKYNGKELDRMHGLDTYDYGARQYDPILARWDRIDPLCEKYYNISPYAYCANNPVRFIDPDGREVKQPKGGKSFKTVGILGMVGGSLMMAGATVYSVATDGVGVAVGGGQLFSAGYATFNAGLATYCVGVAIDAHENVNKPEPANISNSTQNEGKKSVDSGKNERHGDGGRSLRSSSMTKRLNELDAQIKNAPNKQEKNRLKKKKERIEKTAQRKERGEEHSRGNKR
jgi:RHS repeat-associated protein